MDVLLLVIKVILEKNARKSKSCIDNRTGYCQFYPIMSFLGTEAYDWGLGGMYADYLK